MKPLVVHAFFVGQPGTAGYPRLMQICAVGAVREETNSFSKETPSLSLRLRSVKAVLGPANAARTIEQHSSPFELRPIPIRTDMSNLNFHFRLLNARRNQPCSLSN
jgi:hypothetical protein